MKYLNLIFIFIIVSCSNKKDDVFLNEFVTKTDFDASYFNRKSEIEKSELDRLVKTDEVNKFVFNRDIKYHYGYKIKLDDNHYLLNYSTSYRPIYRPNFSIHGWVDSFLCIYDVQSKSVISKIRVCSTDPIISGCEKVGDTYVVNSLIKSYRPNEDGSEKVFVELKNLSKYKIVNYRFEEVSNLMVEKFD